MTVELSTDSWRSFELVSATGKADVDRHKVAGSMGRFVVNPDVQAMAATACKSDEGDWLLVHGMRQGDSMTAMSEVKTNTT